VASTILVTPRLALSTQLIEIKFICEAAIASNAQLSGRAKLSCRWGA
jgi:hypothetical protein